MAAIFLRIFRYVEVYVRILYHHRHTIIIFLPIFFLPFFLRRCPWLSLRGHIHWLLPWFHCQEGVEQMVSRLMRDCEEHTPDTNRTMSNSPYKDVISIFTSYQMGGWDYWHWTPGIVVQNRHESRRKYWAVRLFARSACALRCAHFFACLLTHSLPSSWESERLDVSE